MHIIHNKIQYFVKIYEEIYRAIHLLASSKHYLYLISNAEKSKGTNALAYFVRH